VHHVFSGKTFIRYTHVKKIGKSNTLKVFRSKEPKGILRIAKIDY